jgi:hypothetical protein
VSVTECCLAALLLGRGNGEPWGYADVVEEVSVDDPKRRHCSVFRLKRDVLREVGDEVADKLSADDWL